MFVLIYITSSYFSRVECSFNILARGPHKIACFIFIASFRIHIVGFYLDLKLKYFSFANPFDLFCFTSLKSINWNTFNPVAWEIQLNVLINFFLVFVFYLPWLYNVFQLCIGNEFLKPIFSFLLLFFIFEQSIECICFPLVMVSLSKLWSVYFKIDIWPLSLVTYYFFIFLNIKLQNH